MPVFVVWLWAGVVACDELVDEVCVGLVPAHVRVFGGAVGVRVQLRVELGKRVEDDRGEQQLEGMLRALQGILGGFPFSRGLINVVGCCRAPVFLAACEAADERPSGGG